MTAATPQGQVFSITDGGLLIGACTLPTFYNCGQTTDLVNILCPDLAASSR